MPGAGRRKLLQPAATGAIVPAGAPIDEDSARALLAELWSRDLEIPVEGVAVGDVGDQVVVYVYGPERQFVYYYAHLDALAPGLAAGVPVRAGQLLGRVGTTGNAPPGVPHLHFAIHKTLPEARWWRGIPLNPFLVYRRG